MLIINRDFRYQDKLRGSSQRHPAMRWALFALASITIGVVIANTGSDFVDGDKMALPTITEPRSLVIRSNTSRSPSTSARLQNRQRHKTPAAIQKYQDRAQQRITHDSIRLPLPELRAQQQIIDDIRHQSSMQWREFKVRSGDSLARLFKRARIKPQQLDELMQSGTAAKILRRIYPSDIIRILSDNEGYLEALSYEINHASYFTAERKAGKLHTAINKYESEVRTTHASGSINSSLFQAAAEAGISENIIMELAAIFGWDIDFVLDIRKGDTFHLLYEQLYRNGEKIADGNILAAEFVNNGKTYRAVRYVNPQTSRAEYFSADGKSMRKTFLRSPVNFARISSKFSTRRYHPVLHKIRAHRGVDYAAKRGTPIRAAGDGKIIHRAKKGGYGRVVILQHGSRYSTLYAHLNSYKRGHRVGRKVKQGDIIGYVGSSGLATGPHLHYEFRLNGVHRNPLTVRLPTVQPVPERYRLDFEFKSKPVLAKLDLLTRTQLASINF